jgi:branched-chain amino acid transport system substrate-binding protein
VRPIIKIGLIAPFEGLYRQSGYAALEAMRQAMADCTPAGMDVLPLALDDSGDPAQAQRAAQKLLVDPTVRAVVGPLLLDAIPAVAAVITPTATIPWFIPPLSAPETSKSQGGFVPPSTSAWLDAQVEYVAAHTTAPRILLLGLPAAWQLQVNTTVPVLRVDDLESALAILDDGDAVLWLGRPDAGARWLALLRQKSPTLEFWLADQAGINIFIAHTTNRKDSHWLLWSDSNYNQWSQSDGSTIQPDDVARYQTYRATCAALTAVVEGQPTTGGQWELQSRPLE